MLTEQRNQQSMNIDQMSTIDILTTINAQDATVAGVVYNALPQIALVVDVITEKLSEGGRLFYIGAGTSGRLGVLDAAECIPTFNTPPEMIQAIIAGGEKAMLRAVEGAEDSRENAREVIDSLDLQSVDVIVGIAASGSTPFVLEAITYAKELGIVTVGIACNTPAPLLDLPDYAIALPVGPEVITGSTRMKSGTAQKLVLNMLSTATMIKLGKVYGNLMVDVQITNKKLANRALRIVAQVVGVSEDDAQSLLEQAENHVKTAIVIGKLGVDLPTAREKLIAAKGQLRRVIEDSGTATIVDLTPEHIPACAEIMANSPLWKTYEVTLESAITQFEQGLHDSLSTIKVAIKNDAVVGFIWYCVRGTFYSGGYIRLIGVAQQFHRQGIGAHLIHTTETDIRQHSPHVFLMASAFNTDAHAFYKSQGYESIGELPGFARSEITEVIFYKSLAQGG